MESRGETTYTPEAAEAARRDEERRLVREGTELWKARKEEQLRQKQREQCEVCVCLHARSLSRPSLAAAQPAPARCCLVIVAKEVAKCRGRTCWITARLCARFFAMGILESGRGAFRAK